MTRSLVIYSLALTFLAIALIAGIFWGTAQMSMLERWSILVQAPDAPRNLSLIVWQWRMPRVLAVALVGAALALSGSLIQTALRNPLADPYLLGLSSGASAAAVAAIIWLPSWITASIGVPMLAFFGALIAIAMTLGLSFRSGLPLSPMVVILAGVAVSLMFQSLTSFFLFIGDPRATQNALGWLMGTAAGTKWDELSLLAIAFVIILAIAIRFSPQLDTLLLGDERAHALGIPVGSIRLSIYLGTALLTALSVAIVGIVGFIGLIIPHMARLLIGARHRQLIPLTVLLGAIILVIVDLLCRVLLAPQELPLGVLLALFAAPPFIIILRRARNGL